MEGKSMELDGVVDERTPSSCNGEATRCNGVKKKKEEKQGKKEEKEGSFLLGYPTFLDLGNGRFRCVETGHEMVAKDKDSYSRSKACRLALIDAALSQKKPPLNTFQPHPLSKSKLVCKLTGDTINKSEEHIWKHISGKRFQNKLEQKELENLALAEKKEKDARSPRKISECNMIAVDDDKKLKADGDASLAGQPMEDSSDVEELDFWIPPLGDRWDFDDGKDRWESCTISDQETGKEDAPDEIDKSHEPESADLSVRAKRMSIAVGPSSFASRKKKNKASSTHSNEN